MDMSTSEDLKRAYRLIKRDQPEEAQAIIRPILDADPANVHAWWLLAYAVDDPNEVRHALNQVLELDPNYSNAPKAREMLAALDAQFPSTEGSFDDVFGTEADTSGGADFFTEVPFGESSAGETFDSYEDSFGDTFDDAALGLSGEDFFSSGDLFADLEGEPGGEIAPAEQPISVDDLRAILEPSTPADAETRAEQEEKKARRQGRGGRLLRVFLVLLSIPVLLIVVLFIVFSGGSDENKDPGALKTVEVQSDKVKNILVSTGSELRLANLSSDSQVIVAESAAGSTLFVQLCGRPDPDLPQLAMQGMDIAAQQAPALEGQLAAVGVSINLCGSEKQDTLYRAYVSVSDAIHYDNGDLGEGPSGQAAFQALWKTS
jgi:hypothetical protein